MKFDGVYIAPVTPVTAEGFVDWKRYEELLRFLLEQGVDGFCIGGGTSEYVHFSEEERKELYDRAVKITPAGKRVFAAIGASSYQGVMELGRHADSLEVDAVLLPMPHFFGYEQPDLEEHCRQVSRDLKSPVLLYNLPFCNNPLDYETSARLLDEEEGIIGIKDSSGKTERFSRYAEDFADSSNKDISLLIGQDPYALDALKTGWDGIISGLGTVCPEILVCLRRSVENGDYGVAESCQRMIWEINDHICAFPFPWAIRFGLECRDLDCGPVSLPLSRERMEQKKKFQVSVLPLAWTV